MTEAEWIAFLRRPEIPAFNRAMLENPDDDLPRLVFADWMDEHCPDAAVNAAVRRSVMNAGELVEWPGSGRGWATRFILRGRLRVYVSGSTLPPTTSPRSLLDAVWRAYWVDELYFHYAGVRAVNAWLNDPPLEFVSAIELDQNLPHGKRLTSKHLRTFLNSPLLRRVRRLNLWGWGWRGEQDWADVVAQAVPLVNLAELTLVSCRMGDEGAAALANSPYLCEAIRARWRR